MSVGLRALRDGGKMTEIKYIGTVKRYGENYTSNINIANQDTSYFIGLHIKPVYTGWCSTFCSKT